MATAITRCENCNVEVPVANLKLHEMRCRAKQHTHPYSPPGRSCSVTPTLPPQGSDLNGLSCSRTLISTFTGTAASTPNDPKKPETLDHTPQIGGSMAPGCSEAVTAEQMDDKPMAATVLSTGAETGPSSKQPVPASERGQQKPAPLSRMHDEERTFQCTAMSGEELQVVADSRGTLGELGEMTRLQLSLPVDDEKVVIFVDGNTVLYNGLRLQRLIVRGSTWMQFMLLPREEAACAQFKARVDFLISEVESMSTSLQPCLSKQEFGETLARNAYKGLREGRSRNGRISFSCRVGRSMISSEYEDSFMLCSGTMKVEDLITDHVAERGAQPTGRYTVIQPQQNFGKTVFRVKSYQTYGSIMLSIGGVIGYSWLTEDEFADFWKSMSDYRVAALCAGYFVEGMDMFNGGKYLRAEVPLTAEDFRQLAA